MYLFHSSGTSLSSKIASTGHSGSHAPQSMHSSGFMYKESFSSGTNPSALASAPAPVLSCGPWIQSTGQTSTQAVSQVPTQGSQITYVILVLL